jgi:protein TonB
MGHKGIAPPKIVNKVSPDYPEDAKKQGIQGKVILSLVITDQGLPTQIKVDKSDNELLNAAAMEAVSQWRWESPKLDGKPVNVHWTVTLNFRLS